FASGRSEPRVMVSKAIGDRQFLTHEPRSTTDKVKRWRPLRFCENFEHSIAAELVSRGQISTWECLAESLLQHTSVNDLPNTASGLEKIPRRRQHRRLRAFQNGNNQFAHR